LVNALSLNRDECIRPELIDSDADALYKAGESKWETDDSNFINIFTTRSWEHLQEVNKRYTQQRGHDLKKAIGNETSGWFKVALLSCLSLPIDYWAERCHEAVQGLGTDDKLIIRCFSENSKPFLQEVAKAYQRMYNKSLIEDIRGDTSGNYREILEALLDLPENERVNYC